MAYFAKLGIGNIVEEVIFINNAVITDADGVEQTQLGLDFINNLFNTTDIWKQTSYNNNIRKNYAGIGYTYDEGRDAFIAPRPYNSWTLNEDTCTWEAPTATPDEVNTYNWNEETLAWDLVS
tara:strand:+ start:1347 stop:1712 length:366 start_codon:yes stop_codon:yes gene_type:complete